MSLPILLDHSIANETQYRTQGKPEHWTVLFADNEQHPRSTEKCTLKLWWGTVSCPTVLTPIIEKENQVL